MRNITKCIQILLLSAAACSAATIQIVFDSPNQSAAPDGTIVYSANLFNLTATDIDLGSALVSLGGSLTVDPFPFLLGPAVLPANGSTGSFEIFTVTLPASTPLGSSFPGILSITDLNNDVLGEATFSVGAAVPEPSPGLFVGFAIVLCAGAAIKRPRRQSEQLMKPFLALRLGIMGQSEEIEQNSRD